MSSQCTCIECVHEWTSESTIVGQHLRGAVEHVVVFIGEQGDERSDQEESLRSMKDLRTQKQNYIVAGEAEELSDVADDAQF